LTEWQASIAHYATATVNLNIMAVRSYFRWMTKMGLIEKNIADDIEAPHIKNKEKHYPEQDYIRAMIKAATNYRDKAIITMFVTTGLRVSELTAVTLDDYYKAMQNDGALVVFGKGAKERTVFINKDTEEAIEKYLLVRPNSAAPYLFLSHVGGIIHDNNLNGTIKKLARKAGIPFWQEVSAHWLRVAAATRYAEAGYPLEDIRDLLGHSDLKVLSRYIKSNKSRIANMANAVQI